MLAREVTILLTSDVESFNSSKPLNTGPMYAYIFFSLFEKFIYNFIQTFMAVFKK